MNPSSRNHFEVFDGEEDELAGKMDIKLQSRLNNPKLDDSPSLKYNFPACVANGSDFHAKGSVSAQRVDDDSIDDDNHCSVTVAMQTLTVPVEYDASRPLLGCNGVIDSSFEPSCQMNENIYVHGSSIIDMDNRVSCPGGQIPEDGHISSPVMESPTNSGSINSATSNPVLSIKDRSCPSPDVCADLLTEDQTFRGLDMEETEPAVALHADYVAYQGSYYLASLMTFSDHSIKVESAVMDKDVEALMFEWAVDDDVISIESKWYARGGVVEVQIHVLAKGMVQTENVHDAYGIEELKVVLSDPDWLRSLEKICSLNVKYKAAWKTCVSSPMADDGDALLIDKSELSLRPYFPDFDEHFDEVIYPEGDVDAVSISKRDVDLLRPETFINDTVIDFYIKYLKNKIPTGQLSRFHFFNSFFFRKLADLDKNPDSAFDSKAAFQRVRKWTRKLNLFEKDYIFIPVNFNYHWSLIVICHLGEVAGFAAEKVNESSRVPCVLHMDSIRGNHTGLKNLIQSYLFEEWKERQKEASEDISSKFLNLRFLSLELPQQENYYDCGLFLLHYVELFVEDAPANFNPFNITKFSNFLTADWFIPMDVSLKRPYIQRLIHEILANRSQRSSRNSVGALDDVYQSKLEKDNGIELISVSCNPQNTCTLGSLYSGPNQGIDMNLQGRSQVRSAQCTSQPGLDIGDLYEPGPSSGSFFDQYQRYGLGTHGQPRNTESPTEEEEDEGDEDPLYSMRSGSSLRQLDGLTSEGCNIEYFRTVSWDRSFNLVEHDQEDDLSPDSDNESDDEVKVIEENSERRDVLPIQNEKSDVPKRSLVENFDSLTDSFVTASSEMMETPAEDSLQNSDGIHTKSEQEDLLPSVGENEHQQSPHEPEDQGDAEDESLIVNNSSSDSDEQQPAKRLRLTPLDDEIVPETDQLNETQL